MDEHRVPRPAWAWLLTLTGVAAAVWVGLEAASIVRAHGYGWATASGRAVLSDAATGAARVGWALALAGLLPWILIWRGSSRPQTLARVWAFLVAASVWAWVGYGFNRFGIAGLWRESAELFGRPVPAALTDPGALARNALLTLGAVAGFFLLTGLLTVLLRRRGPALPRPIAAVGIVALTAVTLLGLVPKDTLRPRPVGPDIVLISLDAVRADRLGCYGYGRDTTPHLDRFAAESIRFARATSQEPWTLTSHMSMLTGLYPDAHGLDFGRSLAPAVWTVPERLRDAGYRTYGSVYDCFLLNPQFGYAAGFDHYEVNGSAAARRIEAAADWLESDDRPAFLFLHLYDPHTDVGAVPYEASPQYLERFAPGAAAAMAAWTAGVGASEVLRRVNLGERELDATARQHLSDLYDASLAECDAAVGAFLQRLRDSGRFDNALILVVSDHGEALGERGQTMHEELMDATLHIPLLLRLPGGTEAGSVRTDLVETVDIAPTLLAVAGVGPEAVSQGTDLRLPSTRTLAFHRSGPAYAVSTLDGWRLFHRRAETGLEWDHLRRYGPGFGAGDGPDVLPDSLRVIDPYVEPTLRWHEANRAVARRFSGAEVRMSGADADLLRSLGYID